MLLRTLFFTAFFISNALFGQVNQDSVFKLVESKTNAMPDGVRVSIAILKDGMPSYYGFYRNKGRIEVKELSDAYFEIGSITKTFTTTLLAEMVLSNKIKINDDIHRVFPFKFNKRTKVSYLALANHTAGLPRLSENITPCLLKNPENPYSEFTNALMDEYLMNEFKVKRKQKYLYSNLGMSLLSYAIERSQNEDFEELLRKFVLEKYGLEAIGYDLKTTYPGIGADGKEVANWTFQTYKGAGGLVANCADLVKYILAHFNDENKALALTREQTFLINQGMALGLGWHILRPNDEQEKTFWHNGGTGGFTSSLGFKTANQTGVVVLTNLSAAHSERAEVDNICFELLDLIK